MLRFVNKNNRRVFFTKILFYLFICISFSNSFFIFEYYNCYLIVTLQSRFCVNNISYKSIKDKQLFLFLFNFTMLFSKRKFTFLNKTTN